MKTNLRNTSLSAYLYVRGNGIDLNQKGKVIHELLMAGAPLTRSEVSKRSDIPINAITGRVSELIADGFVIEISNTVKCTVTGMFVHAIKPTGKVYE